MREIFDWRIMYEALSGIPVHFGTAIRDSIVVCMMDVDGRRARLGNSARIDADAMAEPEIIASILEAQAHYGGNGALIAVVHPEPDRRIDEFFRELTAIWPLEYHAGFVLQTDGAIAASCACGDDVELGDELELLTTETTAQNVGRAMWGCDVDLRVRRTPGGKHAETMARLCADSASPGDTASLTAFIDVGMRRFSEITMRQKAEVVTALREVSFRDGFLAWSCSRAPRPADFAGAWFDYEVPCAERIDSAIRFLTSLCRWLPEGEASVPIACAAYLAWYSGHGMHARVLTEQAEAENPEYSLTRLMSRIVGSGAPPPWVSQRGQRLVS